MQYRATHTVWQTKDDKLQFRQISGGIWVQVFDCSIAEAQVLVDAGLMNEIGPTKIKSNERGNFLRTAASAMKSAGYHLDIACWRYAKWKTSDGRWILLRRNVDGETWWTIRSRIGGIILPDDTSFPTRDAAVEWAQRQTCAQTVGAFALNAR